MTFTGRGYGGHDDQLLSISREDKVFGHPIMTEMYLHKGDRNLEDQFRTHSDLTYL